MVKPGHPRLSLVRQCRFGQDTDREPIRSDVPLTAGERDAAWPAGVGKTHLAVALAVKAAQAGHSIYFTTMADQVARIKEDETSGRSVKARPHSKAALVVVEDVGYTPIDRRECYLLFRFVSRRYEKASIVITSNKGFGEWTELFEDPIIVTALLDRLLHHGVIVNIKGQSYRLKGKGSPVRKSTVAG